jgi:hypothetical protein
MPEDRLYGHIQADLDLLSDLMRRNPTWVQPDGSCPRALEVLRVRAASPEPPQTP